MDGIRDALLRILIVCEREINLDHAMCNAGFKNNSHFGAWSELADAICIIIGEPAGCYTDSVTYKVLNGTDNAHKKIDDLMDEYRKNHPIQPAPKPIDPKQMTEEYKKNGGYMYQTPEGDWS